MGKRSRDGPRDKDFERRKKYKIASGILDPSTAGVYITCPRNREQKCTDEILSLFQEKIEEYGIVANEEDDDEEEELSVEDAIKKELKEMNQNDKKNKKPLCRAIKLGQECLVFIKLRKPIDPENFIKRIFEDTIKTGEKKTRYCLKLIPVQSSCSASLEEITKLAKQVMARHFHQTENQPQGIKFAINVSRRNFNTIPKEDLIKKVAECMGHENDHKVDLKKPDKVIILECFKNNVGVSVLDNYEKYCKYNIDQLYEKVGSLSGPHLTRVEDKGEKK